MSKLKQITIGLDSAYHKGVVAPKISQGYIPVTYIYHYMVSFFLGKLE